MEESSIEFLDDSRVVHVHVRGHLTTERALALAARTNALRRERGWLRTLVDLRETTPGFSILELLDLPKQMIEAGEDVGERSAYLYPHGSHADEDYVFFQQSAVRAGMHVRLFTDRDEALAWLVADGAGA